MKKIIFVLFLLLLVSGCQTYSPKAGDVVGSGITVEEVTESVPIQDIPVEVTTEVRNDFVIESNQNIAANFNILVNLSDGRNYNLGKFGFVFKPSVVFYGQQGTDSYNLVGYILPSNWNIESINGQKQITLDNSKLIHYDFLEQDPIFLRGRDYPSNIPFEEVELQVQGIRYFSDINQTDFVAFVRVRENEEDFYISSIILTRS